MSTDKTPSGFKVRLAGTDRGGETPTYSRLGTRRREAITDAVVAKLMQGIVPRPTGNDGKKQAPTPTPVVVQNTAHRLAGSVNDAKNMMKVLPDLEMVKQLLISTILSPQDLMKVEFNFRLKNDDLGEYGPPMLAVVEDFFRDVYKIEGGLEKALEKILFKSGSHVVAVIPESAVDEVINGDKGMGFENLRTEYFEGGYPKPYGILGPAQVTAEKAGTKTVMESLIGMEALVPNFGTGNRVLEEEWVAGHEHYGIRITDNPNVLKTSLLREKLAKERLAGIYEARSIKGRKDRAKGEDEDSVRYENLFKRRNGISTPIVTIKTLDELTKPTVGHPMVMEFPSEAVIPVHVPGDPRNHIGYFVLLDPMGYPLDLAAVREYLNDTTLTNQPTTDMREALLRDAARIQEGVARPTAPTIEDLNRIYADVIEDDLTRRLQNGVYGSNVTVSRPTEVYRIMMARKLAGQQTQLLFLPADLVTYMAFDYNEYGQGVSLMEQNKTTGTIRALLRVANTLATIKNSVNHVNMNITLDPSDPDPSHTVEMMYHEYMRSRQFRFPQAVSGINDLADFMQSTGVGLQVSGNEAYPETKCEIENRSGDRVEVNTDLDDLMKKQHYLGFGVTPEMVDQSMTADFATSIIQQNLLSAKRALLYGKEFAGFYTDFMRKFTMNDEALMEQLRAKVKDVSLKDFQEVLNDTQGKITTTESAKEEGSKTATKKQIELLVMHFLDNLEVTLPEPDLTQFKIQYEAYKEYSDALDDFLSAVINTDMYTSDNMGEIAGSIDQIKAVMKAELQREWLRKNNIMPELFELFDLDDEADHLDLLKRHQAHLDKLAKSMLSFAKVNIKRKELYDSIFTSMGGEEAESSSSADDNAADDGMGGGADDEFGMGGMDDLGLGDETPPAEGADNPEEEAAPETETEAAPAEEETPPEEPEQK